MRGQGKVPDCWIHRPNSLGTSGAQTSISWRDQGKLLFVLRIQKGPIWHEGAIGRKPGPILFLLRSSSLGRAAPGVAGLVPGRSSFLLMFFIGRLSGRDTKLGGLAAASYPTSHNDQLVEMVKFTVILAWVSTASAPW